MLETQMFVTYRGWVGGHLGNPVMQVMTANTYRRLLAAVGAGRMNIQIDFARTMPVGQAVI